MDYDDNDFQSQNFHLVGEDNNRFPPTLRSFTLPKYDLDDNLQVHLGFGIDETEVLLGIRSQQDNHWIEDFSQGGSGIEFNASAADSCSISRRNNVWSEATSSESVEMLLKSVGQDEGIAKQTVLEEPIESGDGLKTNQMDSSTEKNQSFQITSSDFIGTGPSLAPEKSNECLPDPHNEGIGGISSPLASNLNNNESNQAVSTRFSEMSLNVSSEKYNVTVAEASEIARGDNLLQSSPCAHKDENPGSESKSENNCILSEDCSLKSPNLASLDQTSADGSTENNVDNGCRFGFSLISEGPGNSTMERSQDSCTTPMANQGTLDLDCRYQHHVTDDFSEVQAVDKLEGSPKNDPEEGRQETFIRSAHIGVELEQKSSYQAESGNGAADKEANIIHDAVETSYADRKRIGNVERSQTGEGSECVFFLKPQDVLPAAEHSYEVFSSSSDNKHECKGKSTCKDKVVKVFSPADLIQTTGEGQKLKISKHKLGCHATEAPPKDLEPHTAVDEVIENETPIALDVPIPAKTSEISALEGACLSMTDNMEKIIVSAEEKCSEPALLVETSHTVSGELQGLLPDLRVEDESVSLRVDAGDYVKMTSSSEVNAEEQFISGNALHVESVERKESGIPSLPVTDSVDFDAKEESLAGVSTQPTSSDPVPNANPVPMNSNAHAELPSGIFGGPPGVVESSTCVNESHTSLTPISAEQENASGSDVDALSMGASPVKRSSPDISHRAQKDDNVICLTEKDQGQEIIHKELGDTTDDCEERSRDLLPENVTKPDSRDASNALNLDEPSCGSPIVISSNEQVRGEKEHLEADDGSVDQSGPVGDDLKIVDAAADKQIDVVKPLSTDVSEGDRSFTFEVGPFTDPTEGETSKAWKPFPSAESFEVIKTKEPPITPSSPQTASAVLQDTSSGSKEVSKEQEVHEGPEKDSNIDRRSGGATNKGTSTKGKSVRETSSRKQKIDREGKLSSSSPSGAVSRAMQVEDQRLHPHADGSGSKGSAIPTIQTSNLPDLNSSASPVLFHQPFTDSQQVQLRAQIFVYGSLIQGTAPDEACMVSAFADSSRDGGRSVWLSTWQAVVERLHNQKSPLVNLETPVASRSGARLFEEVPRSMALPSKPMTISSSLSGNKVGASSPILDPATTSSSALCSISSPIQDVLQSSSLCRGSLLNNYQTLPLLNPYQSPHMRQYMGNTTPWLAQASTAARPHWVVSHPNSTLDAGQHYSTLSIAEAVQGTAIRDNSTMHSSSVPHAPQMPLLPPVGVTNGSACPSVPIEVEKTIKSSSGKHGSAEQKSKKRKKNSSPLDLAQVPIVTDPRAEQAPLTSVSKNLTTSSGILSSFPMPLCKVTSGSIVGAASPAASLPAFQAVGGERDVGQKAIFPEDTSSRVEQAKLQAEEAAALAVSAVKNCQGVWTQLSLQKNSGIVTEIEAKLVSAAVAAAAAASVAKAAAAAAKIASDAALQAKFMADDALGMGNLSESNDTILCEGGTNFGRMTPTSKLKGKGKANSSNSIVTAAREAARKRIETASAAAKRAENLDAVIKAAEIAAEAVAQAGTIVAMGDPVPLKLSELLESGPEGYWKLQQASLEHKGEQNMLNVEGVDKTSGDPKETQQTQSERQPHSIEACRPKENLGAKVDGMSLEAGLSEKGLGAQKGPKFPELARPTGVLDSEMEPGVLTSCIAQDDKHNRENRLGTLAEDGIAEGSVVEVVCEDQGLGGVWFLAKVLRVEDRKGFVCYDERMVDGGLVHLQEWVPLEADGDKPPRVRIPHPMTAVMKYEGTRKRRRAAVGNSTWSVGDRVDVRMQTGWWEAVVTEKAKEDDSKLTVQLSANGHSSDVRVWSLRPSLIWRSGQWVEWSKEKSGTKEGDSPLGKRQKSGMHDAGKDSQVESRTLEALSKDVAVKDSRKPEDAWSKMFTEKDRLFTIGNNAGNDKNSDALKVKRIGLQKEGSKVIFGVPKPGKKRKFMEVSKHYVADKAPGKPAEGRDSVKVTTYSMPQNAGRGWKSAPKVDFRGKQPPDLKAKLQRSAKDETIQGKSVLQKVYSSTTGGHNALPSAKSDDSPEVNVFREQNPTEAGSIEETGKVTGHQVVVPVSTNAPPSKKKLSPHTESDQGANGKLEPTGKLTGEDEKVSVVRDHSAKDNIEPRRSNRRIQPTSRLLEGLQSSSLVVAKMAPISLDKGTKGRQKK